MKTIIKVLVVAVIGILVYNYFFTDRSYKKQCERKVQCDFALSQAILSLPDSTMASDLVCVPCPCDTFCITTMSMPHGNCPELCLQMASKNVSELLDNLSSIEVNP